MLGASTASNAAPNAAPDAAPKTAPDAALKTAWLRHLRPTPSVIHNWRGDPGSAPAIPRRYGAVTIKSMFLM